MAVQKRKAVTTASSLFKLKSRKVKEPIAECEEEQAEQEQEGEQEQEQVSEPVKLPDEAEVKNARRKELKLKAVEDIKTLATSSGIPLSKKEDMIEAIIKHEAKVRADALAHEEEIRTIVVAKKQELEALPLPELTNLCKNIGVTGVLAKPARVEKLLTHWQENDGVDQAVAKKSQDAREQALMALDTDMLQRLCEKAGADPFITEVMVERALRKEAAAGRFCRPKLEQEEEAARPASKIGDMVATLIATEAQRKKEKEQKRQQEEEDIEKRKELKSKSADELKKLLSSKGLDATGKKEDMMEALFQAGVQEAAVAARKGNLKSMSIEDLKKLVSSKGLDMSKKDDMVDALLSHEAKLRKDCEAYQAKVAEALKLLHEELEEKSAAELKSLCAEKALKLGSAKPDRIQTLLEDAQNNGEVDRRISALCRQQRKEALLAMEKPALKILCDDIMVDAFVKPVMIERLLEREVELGCTTELEPAKKKARTAK